MFQDNEDMQPTRKKYESLLLQQTLECDQCDSVFRTDKAKNIHREKCHRQLQIRRSKFLCCKCNILFSCEINLDRHRKKFHDHKFRQNESKCKLKNNFLKRNLKDYPAEKLKQQFIRKLECLKEKCPICESFEIKSTLKDHLFSVHGMRLKSEINPVNSKNAKKLDHKKNKIKCSSSSFLECEEARSVPTFTNLENWCNTASKSVIDEKENTTKHNGDKHFSPIRLLVETEMECINDKSTKSLTNVNYENNDQLTYNENSRKKKFSELSNANYGCNFNTTLQADDRQECCSIKTGNECDSATTNNDDSISIEKWTTQNRNSVLFYKSQTQRMNEYPELKTGDFVLVIMKSEQEKLLKKYGSDFVCLDESRWQSDLYLTSLIVIINPQTSFPCCCMISNRNDEHVFKIFFSLLKKKVGRIISEVLMTDITDSCYNAWIQTMFEPTYRFYSSWNVTEEWNKNLSKINSKLKNVTVYEILRRLLTESSECRFKLLLDTFIYTIDLDIEKFQEYFSKRFERNTMSWAHCYWLPEIVNARTCLENMHYTLVRTFGKAEKIQKLDIALNAVMIIIRKMLECVKK